MKTIARTIIAVIVASVSTLGAQGATNPKIFKKAAEKVWNTRSELFDDKVEIPDSVRGGASAVIMADYNFVDADYEYYENLYSTVNRTRRCFWTRRMVKLYDAKAVEDFSEFEFGQRERLDAAFYTIGGSDNAFGARIHKPDGTVTDVDLNQAVDIKEGKKDREKDVVSRKIAIPGLEPGDILEYFDYTEEWVDELDLPALNFSPMDKYPVMAYFLEGEFSPQLTVEYRTYNGAPSPARGNNDKGDNGIFLALSNVAVARDKENIRVYRQLPFIRLNTLNNTSKMRFYPRSRRGGGLFEHVSTGTIYRDIKYALAVSDYDIPLPRHIAGMVKDFRKAHPEASRRQLVDAAWLAAVYLNETDKKNSVSDYWLALMFCDALKKLDLSDGADTGVGFINSRRDVPTDMIMSWREPDFGALVGDSVYLPSTVYHYLPGEMPGDYQGEKGGAFPGDRNKLTNLTEPSIFTVSTSRAAQNKFNVKARIAVDPLENTAAGSAAIVLSGASKGFVGKITDFNDWARAVEDYFGMPENKRYKDKKYDAVARREELDKEASTLASTLFGKSVSSASDLDVTQRGVVPGAPDMKFGFKFKAEGCVSDAGNDLLLNVGSFAGENKRLEGDDRQRQLDAFQPCPRQYNYDLTFEIPEGYESDPASLEALKVNVNNRYGAYFVSAKTDDSGAVTVNVRERYNAYIIPADNWNDYLQISDAAAAFNDAVLLLKKK